MRTFYNFITGCCLAALAGTAIAPFPAQADERQELLTLKATVVNLVEALVKQGVLNQEAADALISKAEQDAIAEATRTPAREAAPQAAPSQVAPEAAGQKVVRVPYVPEFVKQEIREQVRSELRQDVLADVATKAKQERWGTPDALPAWVSKIKLYGDVRVRHQLDRFGNENPETLSVDNLYLDILEINDAGGISAAGTDAFLNTSENSNRWRERVRLGLTAKIDDRWTFDTRVATGNELNPVSTNVTLGNTGRRFSIQLDRAFLQYDQPSQVGPPWLTATFGRMSNPFFSTRLLWDEDLNFDGAAATVRYRWGEGGLADPGDRERTLSATAGLFPLAQVDFSNEDKWLAAGQLSAIWEFENQNIVQLGTAFYDYIHTIGKRNELGSTLTNSTAPDFLQKGNLLFNIANDPNLDGGLNDQLFGLASDYRLLNITGEVDLAYLAPYHVVLTADIVKNFGFDEEEITRRTGGVTYLYPIKERTLGWQLDVMAGWPEIANWGDWQISGGYRYLQRDAVFDAFTDSDFHLGGTDAKGYVLEGKYGIGRNIWLRAKWLSANEIDGPPLAIDVLHVDLNAKF